MKSKPVVQAKQFDKSLRHINNLGSSSGTKVKTTYNNPLNSNVMQANNNSQ